MLNKIKPAVIDVSSPVDVSLRNSSNSVFVDNVAAKNVELTIDRILNESDVLSEMKDNGEIQIIGAMYNVKTGIVNFYE